MEVRASEFLIRFTNQSELREAGIHLKSLPNLQYKCFVLDC